MRLGILVRSLVGVVLCTTAIGVAEAACGAPVGNTITCTSGQGATVAFASNVGTASNATVHATTYPATLTVSGAPSGATVSSIAVRFNGWTSQDNASGCASCGASRDVGVVLESPLTNGVHKNLQVLSRIGTASTVQTNLTVLIQDGGAALPDPATTPWTSGGTFAPTNYNGTNEGTANRDGEVSPTYSPTGPSSINIAAPTGTSTMASAFSGATVNGVWNVYLADDAGFLFGFGANVTFGSFDLIITYSSASSPSTTTLTRSLTNPYTSGGSSSEVLTATVTSGATGTVTFKDGSTNLTCSAGNPATLSGSVATCTTTFSTEGVHVLNAIYGGDATFVGSTGSANIYAQNHSANTGSTYCNTGAISSNAQSDATYTGTVPYPSVIFIGDGTNSDITSSVSTLSLQLKGLSSTSGAPFRMLLVAPDGTHAFDFWDGPGSSVSSGNYTMQDGASQVPNTTITAGTYGPTAINPPPSLFTPGPPVPAPQVPGSYVYAAPAGSSTFQTAFNGAAAHGAWSLFLHDGNGAGTAGASGGWCITITAATGHPTTTTVTSSANPSAVLGASVSFTATVSSSPTANIGTVTFTEGGSPLTGAPNGGVANVSSGAATIATTSLPEGDHTITASYHDSTNAFNDSFGTITIRIDKATGTPTLTGSTWTYCNTAGITIPAGTLGINDVGPAGPNPSNVMVTNLPGTVSTATLTLKGFKHFDPSFLQSLLVGPNGASAPTSTQTLDFFTNAGGINGFGPQDTTFNDAGSAISSSSPPAPSQKPESFGAAPSFTASPFFTLPGTLQRAASAGATTFASAFNNSVANGVWSVYFDQTTHQDAHSGNGLNDGATSWCMNFIVNPVTGTGTTSHVGPAPNNHMRQGGTGTVSFSLLNNGDANHKGSTGDPDQAVAHAMTVTGTLPSGLTPGTLPTGTPWNCSAVANTVTCTNLSAIAQGSSYTALVIPVNVAAGAPATATVSGFTFSGAGMTAGTFGSDTITIDPSPVLAIAKTHTGTFTQGSTGVWALQVTNTSGTAAGATDGSTVTVTDALPSGWTTVSGVTAAGWDCTASTQTNVLCTSTSVVAGAGGTFPAITFNVHIPANAAVSTSNTGKVFGGGDLTHTNSGNAAFNTDAVTVVQVPATISLTTGNNQTVAVNTAFPTILSVTVLDGGNVAINNLSVTFTAPSTGASGKFVNNTNTTSTTTNASGVATATTYTSNATAGGPYNISVTAGSLTNNFSETNIAGTPTQMTANPGTTPQTATVNTAFTNALAVTVTDALNNPVSGKTVTFTAPASLASGKFTNNSITIAVITDGTGLAAAPFTANAIAGGPYTVTAVAGGLTTVNFSLTNAAGAASTMTANTGTTPQSAVVGTAFTVAPAVTIKDALNNPVSGVNVTFTAPGSGASGTFSNSTATIIVPTNTSGVASAPFTANSTVGGSYTVTAAASGLTTVNFLLTNTVGAPATMLANPGTTPQSATVNTAFTNALAVTVKDAAANPVSGVNVTFTAPSSGASGTFTNSTATIVVPTNSSGIAAAPITANGTAAGPYTVTAAASGLTTVNFSLTNSAAGPVITTNPSDLTVNASQTATFTAAASGTPTPTVQWQVSTDGGTTFTNLAGATTTTLSFTATASANGNKYRAAFTNTGGSATTTNGTLTVNFAPTVTTNPSSQSVAAGSTANFTAAANGNPTPTVQWQQSTDGGANFSNIAGATSTTLSFTATAGQNGNQYRAVFTNSVSSATTTAATLTVTAGPAITLNPANTTVNAGLTATFTAAATGTPTPTVQWQVSTDGGTTFTNLAGATTTTLSFTATASANGNKYRAVFTNTGGSATTTNGTLTVNFAPTVTTNPSSQSVAAGSTANFTAAANGNPTPTVQWQQSTDGGANFSNIAGATSTTLSFTATAGQNGNQYRAVFTNTVGTATTTAATLTVTAGPAITLNPANTTVNAGQTAIFTAAASGTPTPTVQWQVSTDGGSTFSNVAGATTTTLSFTATAVMNGNKYRAVFTNTGGSATTTNGTLTVNFAPAVTTNPTSQSVSAGSTVNFIAAANGNPTPTVQWQQSTDGGANFSNIAGATSTTLSFTTTAGQNGNQYRAVFTNTVGPATTTAATLTVTAGPAITLNPANTTVNAGQTAIFTAAATGTPTPTVQWQVSTDGGTTFSNVAGATTTTLSFTANAGMNGNKYRAVFTNTGGSATTTNGTLTVNFAPTVTTNPVNQTVSAGSTASFTAAASGNPTPTVQWQVSTDGGATFANVAGATSTTLSFTASVGQNGNQYRAVFTNTVSTATTTAATLTVNAGPAITLNPVNVTVAAGATATFTANATGTPTPTVQWQVSTDGGSTFSNVAGATTTTLSFIAALGMNGNKYRAVFTNAGGSATTTNATLTVNALPPPTIVAFKVLWGNTSYNVTGSPRNRLPWQITGIQVVFSAPMTSGNVNSLGGGVVPTAFSGLGTTTLTWTINPTADGQITATLAGSGPNALMDGNNTPLGGGAGASQVLRILYGDYNDDGVVNALDLSSILNVSRGTYDLFADLNGNGVVDVTDVQIARTQVGNTLP